MTDVLLRDILATLRSILEGTKWIALWLFCITVLLAILMLTPVAHAESWTAIIQTRETNPTCTHVLNASSNICHFDVHTEIQSDLRTKHICEEYLSVVQYGEDIETRARRIRQAKIKSDHYANVELPTYRRTHPCKWEKDGGDWYARCRYPHGPDMFYDAHGYTYWPSNGAGTFYLLNDDRTVVTALCEKD